MRLSYGNAVWLILIFALAVRVAAAFAWHQVANEQGELFRLGDSHSYWTLAEQIAEGGPYQYGSENAQIFRAPLFPIFLAPFTKISDPSQAVLAARIGCCLLSCLAIALLIRLAERIGGRCAGLACGALAAVHPGAIGMSFVILSEALFLPWMVIHLLFLQKALENRGLQRTRYAAIGGVAAGLAVLTRPSWLFFIPFAAVVGSLAAKPRGGHWIVAGVALLSFAITMSPWWIRNALLTGQFVPTTLQVGLSLYDGLHAGASGASDEGMAFAQKFQAEQLAADAAADGPLPATLEYRVDQRARSAAVQWALHHPEQVLKLAWNKFLRTWSLWPNAAITGSALVGFALSLGTLTIVLLAIYGTFKIRAVADTLAIDYPAIKALVLWMPCIYFTLLHMLFVGSVRYREPAVFVLSALAGLGFAWLAGCYSDTRFRPWPFGDSKRAHCTPANTRQGSASERHQSESDGTET